VESGRAGRNPFGVEYQLTERSLRGFSLADRPIGVRSMKTHAYEYRYAKPPGTFGRCHCFRIKSRVRGRIGQTLPLPRTSTIDDIEKGEPVAYLRLSRRERLQIHPRRTRDSLSFDHRVYLGAEGIQSERLGQHVHAWIEEVASEGSVLSVA
jgi:hypothetical protein